MFLDLVREFEQQGRPVSVSTNASNYAPRMFAKLSAGKRCGYREADLRRAMETLFAEGKIENIAYGRKSDERRKIVSTEEE